MNIDITNILFQIFCFFGFYITILPNGFNDHFVFFDVCCFIVTLCWTLTYLLGIRESFVNNWKINWPREVRSMCSLELIYQ